MKRLKLLALLFCLPLFSSSADAPHGELLLQQTRISSALREALTSSRESMTGLEASYRELQNLLAEQSAELTKLSVYLTNTMNSFWDLSERLQTSAARYNQERARRARLTTVLIIMSGLFVLMVLAKISCFALLKKGVKLPAWVKIIA